MSEVSEFSLNAYGLCRAVDWGAISFCICKLSVALCVFLISRCPSVLVSSRVLYYTLVKDFTLHPRTSRISVEHGKALCFCCSHDSELTTTAS